MNKNKKWCVIFLTEFLSLLIVVSLSTILIDPFFHYHKPLSFLQYPIEQKNQRYQNNGIIKNFDYDALIIGTSMSESFLPSIMDELFGTNSIKVPFPNASLKEINQNLEIALENNDKIKYVVRPIDCFRLVQDKDKMNYDLSLYPTYLYNDDLLDDVKYIFNKEVFLNSMKVLLHTFQGKKTTTFDEYSNWSSFGKWGKEYVDASYQRLEYKNINMPLYNDELNVLLSNVQQNLIQVVKDNPDTQFYYFYTPYSIYYWDYLNNKGELLRQIEAEKITTELLLEYDNVRVFSFWQNIDVISNLDNYCDCYHYSEKVNSLILTWLYQGKYLLTKENYNSYYDEIEDIYVNYDYDSLFE